MSASPSIAGPSRTTPTPRLNPPPAPSTSGDSESTVPLPVEKGLDVSVLKELAKSALVESLNDVSFTCSVPSPCGRRGLIIQIQGAKTLILDPGLAGPLGLITDIALLKVYLLHSLRMTRH